MCVFSEGLLVGAAGRFEKAAPVVVGLGRRDLLRPPGEENCGGVLVRPVLLPG